MTRVDLPEGGHCYYEYDADGKRVGQDTAEGHRTFVYQGPDMLRLQMERDENDQTIAQYTMGNGLAAMRRDDASSFYHYNHLGTTLALTDAEEAVTDTYRHDAWGVLLERTGMTDNPHTYVGRERYYSEADVTLMLLGLRYYAPEIGRFVTVDPARVSLDRMCLGNEASSRVHRLFTAPTCIDGTRPYAYVHQSPTSSIDPCGLYILDKSCHDPSRPPGQQYRSAALYPALERMAKWGRLWTKLRHCLDCWAPVPKGQVTLDDFEDAMMKYGHGPVIIRCGGAWCAVEEAFYVSSPYVPCGLVLPTAPTEIHLCRHAWTKPPVSSPQRCDYPKVECVILHEMMHVLYGLGHKKPGVAKCMKELSWEEYCPVSTQAWISGAD